MYAISTQTVNVYNINQTGLVRTDMNCTSKVCVLKCLFVDATVLNAS